MVKTLSGITWGNPRGYNPLVASAKLWAERRPDVHVEWEQRPWMEFEKAVVASLESAKGRYDLVMLDHPWVGLLSSREWLRPYNEILESSEIESIRQRIVAPSLESYEMEGKLWALPVDAACHSALIRSDLTDLKQLPKSWEEVRRWAEDQENSSGKYNLVLSLNGVLGTCLFLSMMASLGEKPYAAERSCCRKNATKVLRLLSELLEFVPPGSTRWGPWDIHKHMTSCDDVAYCPSVFPYVNYFSGGSRQDALRLRPCPLFEGRGPATPILGGVGLGIAHSCQHIQEAVEYATFVVSDEVQRGVFPEHDGQPAALAAWNDSDVNRSVGNFYNDLAPGIARAYTRPRDPEFQALELQIGETLQRFFDGEQDLESTLDLIHALD